MNDTPRRGPLPWAVLRTQLDRNQPFNTMRGTPYYRDAVYEQFSKQEYARRYAALREKMRAEKLDAVIVPGGPSHWSFGGGMLWLTGHWEWHALCCYVLVPLAGEPTLIYSMGGTHAEAVRRETEGALADVRGSRGGRYADVMVERLKELKLERGRIGLLEIDPRHRDYLPVNQYHVLRDALPDATIVFTHGWMHELLSIHSAEELACVRKAGLLCQRAMEAMAARAKPGVTEYELRAAGENARTQATRADRARRPESLELRRRHAVADRPLGVARALKLRRGAARRRTDFDLLDGRHPRRSRAPAGRGRGQRRPP